MTDTVPPLGPGDDIDVELPAILNPILGLPLGLPFTLRTSCVWCRGRLSAGFTWFTLARAVPMWNGTERVSSYPPLPTCSGCELYIRERRWNELLDLVVPEAEREARMTLWRLFAAHLAPDAIPGRICPPGTLLMDVRQA